MKNTKLSEIYINYKQLLEYKNLMQKIQQKITFFCEKCIDK